MEQILGQTNQSSKIKMASTRKQNGEILIDLNLISLKKQVNVIWLSKVITNMDMLEKRTGISKIYIDYILNHQDEILKRWSCSRQKIGKEIIEHNALHCVLMEWTKRMFWDGHRSIEPCEIEHKAMELKKRLCVPNYEISSNFWEEFIAFKLKEIDNYTEHTSPLSTEAILVNCKNNKRIDHATYEKFINRLKKPAVLEPNNVSVSKEEEICYKKVNPIGYDGTDNDIDNDVVLIEEPIECIDVDMLADELQDNTGILTEANKDTNEESNEDSDRKRNTKQLLNVKAEPESSGTEDFEDILPFQYTREESNEQSKDQDVETYIEIIPDRDDMSSLGPKDSSQPENILKILQNVENNIKTSRKTETMEKYPVSKRKCRYPRTTTMTNETNSVSKTAPTAKEMLKCFQKQKGIVENTDHSSDNESNDKSIEENESTDSHNDINDDDSNGGLDNHLDCLQDINDREANVIDIEYSEDRDRPENEEERDDFELLDNIIYEWSKRYVLNCIKPELKPQHILHQVNKLKTKLTLPKYRLHIQLWNDIFVFKAKHKSLRYAKVKSSMNILKILCDDKFDAPRKTFFKFMNILRDRMPANGELRTYIGKNDSKEKKSVTKESGTVDHVFGIRTDSESKLPNITRPANDKQETNMKIFNKSPTMSSEHQTVFRAHSRMSATSSSDKTSNSISCGIEVEKGTNSLDCFDSTSASTDYDIFQKVQDGMSAEQSLRQNNDKTQKRSHMKDLPVIPHNEKLQSSVENIYNDPRTGITYKITEVLSQEDNLNETNIRHETDLDNDDALLFPKHEIEMMTDGSFYEQISKIKQEVNEDSADDLDSTEEEFISCKDIVKQIETQEDREECNRDNIDEQHNLDGISKAPTPSDLRSMEDVENEDIEKEIYRVLSKGNLKSSELSENETNDDVNNISEIVEGEYEEDADANESLEILKIIQDDDGDGESADEDIIQCEYVDKNDSNRKVVMDNGNTSQDNSAPKPNSTTPCKRKTLMESIDQELKRTCCEPSSSQKEQTAPQNQIQANEMEANNNNNKIVTNEKYDNDEIGEDADTEESVMILEIVSEDEDDDDQDLTKSIEERPEVTTCDLEDENDNDRDLTKTIEKPQEVTTCTTRKKSVDSKKEQEIVKSLNKNNSTDPKKPAKTHSTNERNLMRQSSVQTAKSIPKDQPILANTIDAIEYLVKLKDFLRQRNHQMALQLALNLELTFIYHDIER